MAGFRRFIIVTAEVMVILIVILMTIASAISGATGMQAAFSGQYWIVGALLGAVGATLAPRFLQPASFFLWRSRKILDASPSGPGWYCPAKSPARGARLHWQRVG